MRQKRWLSGSDHWLLWQRTWVWLRTYTWQLTIVFNSDFRDPMPSLFSAVTKHTHYTRIYIQTQRQYMYKIENKKIMEKLHIFNFMCNQRKFWEIVSRDFSLFWSFSITQSNIQLYFLSCFITIVKVLMHNFTSYWLFL